jgi:tetratricopeptide (TPR) repeat protein
MLCACVGLCLLNRAGSADTRMLFLRPMTVSVAGMCFFGKQKHVAAIACLKKALYLDSFEWIISYNLGLVYLNTRQYASAFHFLSSSINLKPDFPSSYMYLAIILSRLDDFENACNSYEKAIEMEQDYLFHLVRIAPLSLLRRTLGPIDRTHI